MLKNDEPTESNLNEVDHKKILEKLPSRVRVINKDKEVKYSNEFSDFNPNSYKFCYQIHDRKATSCSINCCGLEEVVNSGQDFSQIIKRDNKFVEIQTIPYEYDENGSVLSVLETEKDVTAQINLQNDLLPRPKGRGISGCGVM